MAKKFQPPPAYLQGLSGRVRASIEGDSLVRVPLGKLLPNPHQPRKYQDPAAIRNLTESIRHHGVLEPVLGRKESDGRYTIIAGHRRWAAAEQAGLTDIPLFEKSISDAELLVTALVENLQREDLHPVDEVRALGQLVDSLGTQEKVAEVTGIPRGTLSNRIRVLNLGEEVLGYCAGISSLSLAGLTRLLKVPPAQRLAAAKRLTGGSEPPLPLAQAKKKGGNANVFAFKSKIPLSGNSFAVQVRFRKANIGENEIIEALERALHELKAKRK